MKIICTDENVSHSHCLSLTFGRTYDVIKEDLNHYLIVDDDNDHSWVLKSRFNVVKEK